MPVTINFAMQSIETPELKFLQFDTPALMLVIPCMFYRGDAKEIAIARKLSFSTSVLFTVGTARTVQLSEKVKNKINEELSNGDKALFNYLTGDIIIKNGGKQIKQFDLYPKEFSFEGNRSSLGVVYEDEKTGEDYIAYYYPSDAEKINLLYTLSSVKRRKFMFSEGDSPTRLGLSVVANLIPVWLDAKNSIDIDYAISRNFKPSIYDDLESLSSYNDLIALGDDVKEAVEKEAKEINHITPHYDDDDYDDYGRSINTARTLGLENEESNTVIDAVEVIPVTNPITNPITAQIINNIITGESQQLPLLTAKEEEIAWFLQPQPEEESSTPEVDKYIKEKEEEKYRESRTFVRRHFINERRKIPLSDILAKKLTIHKFPAEVDMDICLQPAVIKKIEWVEQKTLLLYVTDTTKVSEEVLGSFVGFDLEFNEEA